MIRRASRLGGKRTRVLDSTIQRRAPARPALGGNNGDRRRSGFTYQLKIVTTAFHRGFD
jgi:hypothetical protein